MTLWQSIASEIARFRDEIRELPVSAGWDPQRLRSMLEGRYDLETPQRLPNLTREVMGLLREHSIHVTHPRYFGLFNPSVRTAGIVAETLAALYNPQLGAWSHAPAVCELERLTLSRLASVLGLPPDDSFAIFTTGGSEANLSAVLSALADRYPEADGGGLRILPRRPAIYASEESHHSFLKIARMTGLGTEALRFVPTDDSYALDPEALLDRLHSDRDAGWDPAVIVGTAGTTSSGAVDPLEQLADLAAAEEIWFHVDAAWGGAAALSERLRPCLSGIERATSVTWDAHKWLSVPMGAGMFFCRRPDAVRRAFHVSASYMPHDESTIVEDPYVTSVQWSRRAIGLKVFMALAELGTDGYAALIDHQAEAGQALRRKLEEAAWIVVNRSALPVICFTHPRIRAGHISTRALVDYLQRRGKVWLSDVVLGGEDVLRACITSYRTQEEDLDVLIDELEHSLKAE